MGIKNIKNNNNRDSLLSYFVSGKYKQFHSAEKGIVGSGIVATGGDMTEYIDGADVYRAHIFTSTGTFDVTSLGTYGGTVDYLVVAGGGGGGGSNGSGASGAGGGAGGFRTGTELSVSTSPGSYTITVGGGGGGSPISSDTRGTPGSDSVFSSITSTGGGGGGSRAPGNGQGLPGGSGGGEGSQFTGSPGNGLGNTPPTSPPQGNDGGFNGFSSGENASGGGGGAGSPGGNGLDNNYSGAGGDGLSNNYAYGPTNSVTYAGGGGGATTFDSLTVGSGGPGGGGTGATTSVAGVDGTTNTGGGGGGGNTVGAAGAGGSGIVVVRYKIANTGVIAKASGGTITFNEGKTIHTFTSSSSFRVLNPALTSVEYLIVAGGGSGHGGHYPGGAGGQVLTGSTPVSVPAGAYTITIGAGGAQSPNSANSSNAGNPSVFGPIPAAGGLAPGVGPAPANAAVGSFGIGAAGSDTATAPTLENRRGGHGVQSAISGTNLYYGGGGGGAGGNGYETSQGGRGGYGGGGGGGTGPGGPGGTPGNQDGTYGSPVTSLGDAGATNSGGGGGGGGVGACGSVYCGGKAGGSGIVIIAYPS